MDQIKGLVTCNNEEMTIEGVFCDFGKALPYAAANNIAGSKCTKCMTFTALANA